MNGCDAVAAVRFGTPREVNDAVCFAQSIVGPTRRYDLEAGHLVAMLIAAVMLQLRIDGADGAGTQLLLQEVERSLGVFAIASDPAAALRAFASRQPHRYLQAVLPTVLSQHPTQILATITIALARVHAARRRLTEKGSLSSRLVTKRAG